MLDGENSSLAGAHAERYRARRMTIPRIRASVVCVVHEHVLVVRLRDPATRAILHFSPGGKVEPGERPAHAAAREVLEETGLEVVVDERSELVGHYPFVWGGQRYAVTTHFYRATPSCALPGLPELEPSAAPAAYQLAALWIPRADVEGMLSFDENIWRFTRALLS
jgi:8-oxo-dGTP pyrophosphatase MutT (NUDIX family)